MAHNLRRAARAAQADFFAFPHTLRVPPSPFPRDPEASPARHRVAMPCQGRCRARANCWPPCLSWAGSTSAARLVASTVRSFFRRGFPAFLLVCSTCTTSCCRPRTQGIQQYCIRRPYRQVLGCSWIVPGRSHFLSVSRTQPLPQRRSGLVCYDVPPQRPSQRLLS